MLPENHSVFLGWQLAVCLKRNKSSYLKKGGVYSYLCGNLIRLLFPTTMTPRHTRSVTRLCLLCADNVEMLKLPWRDIRVYVTRCVTWQNALFCSYFSHSISCWDEAGSLRLTRTNCWSQTATLFRDSSSCAVDYHTAYKEWQKEMLMWTPDPRQAQNRKTFPSKSCTET